MKSSVFSRWLLVQSESLPGSVRAAVAVLRETAAEAARDACAGARREDDARDDALRDGAVGVQPRLERGANRGVDVALDFGVVETVLRLTLELRLRDEDRENSGETFADIVARQRHAAWRQIVRVDIIADRLADRVPQADLVRAAVAVGNTVYVTAYAFIGRLGPRKAISTFAPFSRMSVNGASESLLR